MASHMKILELENVELKEDNKELAKHSEQIKDDQMSLKVYMYIYYWIATVNCVYHSLPNCVAK